MARKNVKSKKLAGSYATAYQGPKITVRAGTGQSGGVEIPRYDKLGFKMRLTPDSPGMIKAHRGAKLVGGVFQYPKNADVDPVAAARAQALADYNYTANRAGGPTMRSEMARIYGAAYTDEFWRLAQLKMGQSGPGPWRKKQR